MRPSSRAREARHGLGGWFLIVLVLQTACATSPRRADPPPERLVTLTPKTDFAPVRVSDTELREALSRLVLEVPLPVMPLAWNPPAGRFVRASWQSTGADATSPEEGYERLCERRGTPGDCFLLSRDSSQAPHFRARDRFALGLILALRPAMEATVGALRDLSAQAMTSLLSGLSLYLLLLLAPEPISKGIALTMTVLLWGYLGSQLWELLSATDRLWEEAKSASTFHALNQASQRYAQVLGPDTLNVLILLATWKAGARAEKTMTQGDLPGLERVIQNVASAGRIRLLSTVAEAETVSVAGGQLTLALPSGSATVLAMQNQGKVQIHHIATVENEKSSLRGGPWTQRLRQFFDQAGMSMEDPANKIPLPEHKGPHPEAYHAKVYGRLKIALNNCETTVQCRSALTLELKKMADEILEVGSDLNRRLNGKQ